MKALIKMLHIDECLVFRCVQDLEFFMHKFFKKGKVGVLEIIGLGTVVCDLNSKPFIFALLLKCNKYMISLDSEPAP
jgi:hypothetical protein